MGNSINRSSYPNIFGPSEIYGIVAQTGITAPTAPETLDIRAGNYGSADGTYTGNIIGPQDTSGVSFANPEINNLASDLNNLALPTTPYLGGSATFSPGIKYTSSQITPSGFLVFNGSSTDQFYIISNSSITFASGINIILSPGVQANNIYWLAATAITFAGSGSSIYGTFIAGTQITFNGDGTNPYVIDGNLFAQTANVTFAESATVNAEGVCYLKGTKILTDLGYKLIEELKVGDNVVINGKILENELIDLEEEQTLKPVKWVGKYRAPNLNKKSFPICIKADTFGENLPFEDLFISPGHRVILDDKFVLINDLINGSTIFQDETLETIEYYHFELESHSVVTANGILSETYLDFNNYSRFEK